MGVMEGEGEEEGEGEDCFLLNIVACGVYGVWVCLDLVWACTCVSMSRCVVGWMGMGMRGTCTCTCTATRRRDETEQEKDGREGADGAHMHRG